MFLTKVVEKIKTHISCSVIFFFFPKIVLFKSLRDKVDQTDHIWQYSTAYGLCMPHK